MRVSVIIPALNESREIATAIRSAIQAAADEVWVVDGGSRDATLSMAAAAGARTLSAPAGRGVQQNAGAAAASGDVLLFLHADNTLGPTCIEQVRNAIAAGHRYGAFRQRIAASGIGYRLLEWGNAWRAQRQGMPYGDQAIFIHRDLFEAVGGFPATRLMEDWALMRQLRHDNWPILLDGPVGVSARRWQQVGIVAQTWRNWRLAWAAGRGADLDQLASRYPNLRAPESTMGER